MGKKTRPPAKKQRSRKLTKPGASAKPTARKPVKSITFKGKTYLTPGEKKVQRQEAEAALREKKALESLKPAQLYDAILTEIKKEYPQIDAKTIHASKNYERGPVMDAFAAAANRVLLSKQNSLGIMFHVKSYYPDETEGIKQIETFSLAQRVESGQTNHYLIIRDTMAIKDGIDVPLYQDDLLLMYRKIVL